MPQPADFHLAVQYYRQPTPLPSEWEEDLRHVKRLGFTAVQLRPQWAWHEPVEGAFRWDDIDRLLDLTERIGLKVLFKFFVESAPGWLFRNYDAVRVAPDGRPIQPRARGSFYVGGWFPCFDRPLVREKTESFVRAGVLRYRDRSHILGWHLWNEPRCRPFEDCACPDSNALFRRWLADNFGSPEEYSARYGTALADWEDIAAPPDQSACYDTWLWRQYRAWAVADRIRWLSELVRGLDSSRPLFCHVGFNSVLQPSLLDTCDDRQTARHVDVYGTSLPHWTGDFHTFARVDRPALFTNPGYRDEMFLYALQARWIGAVKDYFWVNEIYGNSWNYMAEDFTGQDIRFMHAAVISEGARGTLIWQFRPERFSEESISSGLVASDGSDTERSLAAAEICAARASCPEAFVTWRPEKARVAVVFGHALDMYSELEDAEDLSRAGTVCYRYKDSLKGWYSMLWRLGLAVDIVPAEDLERIGKYDFVALPYLHLISAEQAETLKAYVENGGVLAADIGVGFRDLTSTWVNAVRPGFGLDSLFGCRERYNKAILEPRPLELDGKRITATRMLGRLDPQDGGEDRSGGQGLLIANRTGKGRTYHFGFYPGISYRDCGESACLKLVASLLEESGIALPTPAGAPLVRVRRGAVGEGETQPAAFVLNYEDSTEAIPEGSLAPGRYRCLITGRELDTSGDLTVGPRETLFLAPQGFGA
ncbi:beta-galactosidase [bacterium]|nr:beta-galactosidase [bacterium]